MIGPDKATSLLAAVALMIALFVPSKESILMARPLRVTPSALASKVVPPSITTFDPSTCVIVFATTVTPSFNTKAPAASSTACVNVDFRLSGFLSSSSESFSPEKTM